MTWNTVWPEGNKSVKDNLTRGVDNMAYINDTMGGGKPNGTVAAPGENLSDHFWANAPYDKHHRYTQMPAFGFPLNSVNPTISAGMDGVMYNRLVSSDVGRIEMFYRNNQNIYQMTPSYINIVVNTQATSSPPTLPPFQVVSAVPANVYGEIYAVRESPGTGQFKMAQAFFYTDPSTAAPPIVRTYTIPNITNINNPFTFQQNSPLFFQQDSPDLNIRVQVRTEGAQGQTGNWRYYITYRAR